MTVSVGLHIRALLVLFVLTPLTESLVSRWAGDFLVSVVSSASPEKPPLDGVFIPHWNDMPRSVAQMGRNGDLGLFQELR